MSNVCEICKKGPVAGRTYAHRGLAKKKGGVGIKITGITIRRFLPNLQTVRAMIDGRAQKVKICVKCLKAGKIKKAGKAKKVA
ncbi:MAG: 50S ribosomal protein L28 [Candidatus Omnitrophota bacterium]